MKRINYLFLLAIILLTGCASSGVQVTPEQMTGFQKGITTEADVLQKLGRPNMVRASSDGGKMFVYAYSQSQVRAATLIPVVGAFAGGADIKMSSAMFMFDANGKLTNFSSSQSEYGSGTGIAAGAPMQQVDQPRQ